jgi:hypothetical protein
VLLGKEVGGNRIILKGDSSIVISALRDEGPCNRAYGQVVDDIKTYLTHFIFVEVVHVRRNANKAIHVLAKCAISQLLDNIYGLRGAPPSFKMLY